MTRAEVARAIGRSIATVRRMEGKELHPDVDWQGVHQFDPLEVEEVALELKENGRRRSDYVTDLPEFLLVSRIQTTELERDNLQQEVDALRKKLDQMKEVDQLAAEFLKIAGEAIDVAEGAGAAEAPWLRLRFQGFVRAIPD